MYTKESDYIKVKKLIDFSELGKVDPNEEQLIYHDKYFKLIVKIYQRNCNNIIIPTDRVMPMSESLGLPRAVVYPSDIEGFNIKLINYKNVY